MRGCGQQGSRYTPSLAEEREHTLEEGETRSHIHIEMVSRNFLELIRHSLSLHFNVTPK